MDRLQRGETKALQCSAACTGKLQISDDGCLDASMVCPAHLLLAVKEAWAKKLDVDVKDMKGGVFPTVNSAGLDATNPAPYKYRETRGACRRA